MSKRILTMLAAILFVGVTAGRAQEAVIALTENLVVDSVPKIPASLAETAGRYGSYRFAVVSDWHPTRHEMLIRTRFADTAPIDMDMTGVRVLSVDDNPTNLFVLREQLNSWGLRNDSSSSGEHALNLLLAAQSAGDPYHIAILDQQMPIMDGEGLARAIKADAKLKNTMLVLLTSIGVRGDAARMQEAGFSAYLTKPARESQLLNALLTVWNNLKSGSSAQLVTRHSVADRRAAIFSAEPTQPVFSARVLVVEDNTVNQMVAGRLLEKLGCRVDVATNGREAVETIGLLPYDAIFMDCQMPEMDGFEATQEIRRREGSSIHRPIIAMTANAMQGDRERCLDAGMDDYVSKAMRKADLIEALERHLPKKVKPLEASKV